MSIEDLQVVWGDEPNSTVRPTDHVQVSWGNEGASNIDGSFRSRAAARAGGFINYEGEGFQSWFMNKATRLGHGGTEGAWSRVAMASSGMSGQGVALTSTFGPHAVKAKALGGLAKTAGRGFLSAYLPIDPFSSSQLDAMGSLGGVGKKGGSLANVVRKSGGKLLQKAFAWLGPVVTAYRLGTETQGQGFFGGISKSVRIIGEEGFSTAGMVVGGILGTAIGGIGGTVAGMAVGYAIGEAGSAVWNKAIDIAEAPARIASASWKYFEQAGRRSGKLELGGRTSMANSSGVAYTMRQRALSQMGRSGQNARALLGNEASYMHIR